MVKQRSNMAIPVENHKNSNSKLSANEDSKDENKSMMIADKGIYRNSYNIKK